MAIMLDLMDRIIMDENKKITLLKILNFFCIGIEVIALAKIIFWGWEFRNHEYYLQIILTTGNPITKWLLLSSVIVIIQLFINRVEKGMK